MRTNPVSMVALVVLGATTATFAVLTFFISNDIRKYQGGDGGQESVPAMQKQVLDAKKSKDDLQRRLAQADQQLWNLNVQLDLMQANTLTIRADRDAPIAKATPEDLKNTVWHLAQHTTETHARRLDQTLVRYKSKAWVDNPELTAVVNQRQEMVADLGKRISDEEEKFKVDRDQLSRQLDEIAANKERTDRAAKDDVQTLHNQADDLEKNIRKLLELDLTWATEFEPCGKVVSLEGDLAVVDLGTRDHLLPGTRLAVSAYDKAGRVNKGLVEAIEIHETVALCRVLAEEDDRRHPIGPGDILASPIYSRSGSPTMVVSGEFKTYRHDDLVLFLRNAGVKVVETVGPGVDLLLAGEKSEADQASARQFQIKAVTEQTILIFLHPSFTTSQK